MQITCLFDMDGLLLDTERVFMACAIDALVPRGFDRTEVQDFFFTVVGTTGARTRDRLHAFLGGRDEAALFYKDWHAAVEARLDGPVPLRPYARASLEHLKAQGARMAVVTSTRHVKALAHLRRAGIYDYFEHVTGGDQVTANKPDPAPYLQAAAAIGADPQTCFAFEDSDAGITAAMGAGCHAVQIPDMRAPDTPLPDLGQKVAPDLAAALCALDLATPDDVAGFER